MGTNKLLIAFDRYGNHVPIGHHKRFKGKGKYSLKNNYVIEGTLKYVGYEATRTSINPIWEDSKTRVEYKTSIAFLHDVLTAGAKVGVGIIDNEFCITGKFTFAKRGPVTLLVITKR